MVCIFSVENGIERHSQPSINLSHIKLLRSISKHSMGLMWLKKVKAWKIAIMYYKRFPTTEMICECAAFLYDILGKFSDLMMDGNLCDEIMEDIFAPFNKNDWTTNGIASELVKIEIMPTIDICSHILTMCIESQKTSKTAHYILVKFRFENHLWWIGEHIENNDDLIGVICRGLTTANFATFTNIDEPPNNLSSYEIFTSNYYNIMEFAIKRQSFANIPTIAEMHHKLWNKIAVHKHDKTLYFKIAHQVITIQTLPIVQIIKNKLDKLTNFMSVISTDVLKKNSEETIKLLGQYNKCLDGLEVEVLTELAIKSLQSTSSLKETLDRDSIVLALKILIYALAGYIDEPCNENFNRPTVNEQLLVKSERFLSALLIELGSFINDFKITWKECVESTSIVRFSLTLLDYNKLDSKVSLIFISSY